MIFNKVIYQRLRHIACFIPEILSSRDWHETDAILQKAEQMSTKDWNSLPVIEIDARFKDMSNRDASFPFVRIQAFEVVLFQICLFAYEKLNTLFTECGEEYPGPGSYLDEPKAFSKFVEASGKVSAEEIAAASSGMFHAFQNSVDFYCEFSDSFTIYQAMQILLQVEPELSFLTGVKEQIYSSMSNFPAEIPAALYSALDDLHNGLLLYQSEKGASGKKKIRALDSAIKGCLELFYHLAPLISPQLNTQKEAERREHISQTKLSQTNLKRGKKEKIIKRILQDQSRKSIRIRCEEYYRKHEASLQKLGISKSKTLQNLCTKADPNRQRKNLLQLEYRPPEYSMTFKNAVLSIFQKRNRKKCC